MGGAGASGYFFLADVDAGWFAGLGRGYDYHAGHDAYSGSIELHADGTDGGRVPG